MFTPSVVFLMIANTVAATGAIVVALQAATFGMGRVASSPASAAVPNIFENERARPLEIESAFSNS